MRIYYLSRNLAAKTFFTRFVEKLLHCNNRMRTVARGQGIESDSKYRILS